ncbi:MAG: hemerythrin domain-containing protein [Bacteroidales bacterium]
MITESLKLSDIISHNILLVPVLNRFGIRPGVGEKTIKLVCSQQGIHLKSFLAILNTYNSQSFFPEAEDVDMTVLVQFLRRTHTYYLDYTLPRIEKLISQLAIDCPGSKPLAVIESYYSEYKKQLTAHIEYEETDLFPLISRLLEKQTGYTEKADYFSDKIQHEHVNVEDKLSDLKTILIKFLPPSVNENSASELLFELSRFEQELLDHARFEDKILIPKLAKMLKVKPERHG